VIDIAKKPKSHKSLKDQGKKLWPKNEKIVKALKVRMGNHPYVDFAADKYQYSPELEALLKPNTKRYQQETILEGDDLDLLGNANELAELGLGPREMVMEDEESNPGVVFKVAMGMQRGGTYIPTIEDLWRPGPEDEETFKLYIKPYLTARESKVMFLRISCRLTAKEVALRMKEPETTLQKVYERAKEKAMKNGGQ
jgi:hypothetical protein